MVPDWVDYALIISGLFTAGVGFLVNSGDRKEVLYVAGFLLIIGGSLMRLAG